MLRTLLLIARWIGLAHDRWRERVARSRPLAAESMPSARRPRSSIREQPPCASGF